MNSLPAISPLTSLSIGPVATDIADDSGAARDQFRTFRAMYFRNALQPAFLANLIKLCDAGAFVSDQTEPGHREVEHPQRVGRALNLVLSRPAMLRWLEATTGCGPLDSVHGRIAQTFPRPGDELTWHDDRAPHEDRRLAIVILLGTTPYEGGEFELRPKRGELMLRHKHTEPGSMLVFAVDAALQHRVLPLTSGGPRRVFAGWAMGTAPPQ